MMKTNCHAKNSNANDDSPLLVVHIIPSINGGIWSVVKELIIEQLNLGMKIAIITSQETVFRIKQVFGESILIYVPKMMRIKYLNQVIGYPLYRIYRHFKKIYNHSRIVLHSHTTSTVGIFSRIRSVPLIVTIHGINSKTSKISHFISNIIVKRLNWMKKAIIGVSKGTSDYYNKIIKSDGVSTIYNGYSLKGREKNKTGSKFLIGFVASLNYYKGWLILFDAFLLLPDDVKSNSILYFAGLGSSDEEKTLMDLIDANKHFEIKYLGPIIDAGINLIPKLDVIVLPSLGEGLSMTLLEANANGIPILATNVRGNNEVVIEGFNGFLLDRNASSFANKLEILYRNPQMKNEMSNNCLTLHNKLFSSKVMALKYRERYYEQISRFESFCRI